MCGIVGFAGRHYFMYKFFEGFILRNEWKQLINIIYVFKMYLLLCGSSMSVMEYQVLGKESSLYGRRTGSLRLSHWIIKKQRCSTRICLQKTIL